MSMKAEGNFASNLLVVGVMKLCLGDASVYRTWQVDTEAFCVVYVNFFEV
jgi:hypothetical protein